MDQNTHTNADYADNADYDSANLMHSDVIFHPYHVTLFSKTCQNLLFVLEFP